MLLAGSVRGSNMSLILHTHLKSCLWGHPCPICLSLWPRGSLNYPCRLPSAGKPHAGLEPAWHLPVVPCTCWGKSCRLSPYSPFGNRTRQLMLAPRTLLSFRGTPVPIQGERRQCAATYTNRAKCVRPAWAFCQDDTRPDNPFMFHFGEKSQGLGSRLSCQQLPSTGSPQLLFNAHVPS